ncbi:MAG: ribosomal L7Ae/L30e/S12e/Gadd45 family protein [Clostridia bacterium]|nr:ribosomal L7Ae/L30e/S12e/Gadd45 family protein [Clostridia bacterium]
MDNNLKNLLFRIGLARKAGKLISGTELVCDAVRDGKVKLVVIASDASANSMKRITNCVKFYEQDSEIVDGLTTSDLGYAIGKSPVACIGITDDNFKKLILKGINQER